MNKHCVLIDKELYVYDSYYFKSRILERLKLTNKTDIIADFDRLLNIDPYKILCLKTIFLPESRNHDFIQDLNGMITYQEAFIEIINWCEVLGIEYCNRQIGEVLFDNYKEKYIGMFKNGLNSPLYYEHVSHLLQKNLGVSWIYLQLKNSKIIEKFIIKTDIPQSSFDGLSSIVNIKNGKKIEKKEKSIFDSVSLFVMEKYEQFRIMKNEDKIPLMERKKNK